MFGSNHLNDYIRLGTPPLYEFLLPKEFTSDGKITFTWTCWQDDSGDRERGSQVAEFRIIEK